MRAWVMTIMVVAAACRTEDGGIGGWGREGPPPASVPGAAPVTMPGGITPDPGWGPLAGARLPATAGLDGPQGPASEGCFRSDDQPADCGAPGGRRGVRSCTTQRWGRSEVRPLSGRATFTDDDDLYPGAVVQGRAFAGGALTPVPAARAAGHITVGSAGRDVATMDRGEVQAAVADLIAAGTADRSSVVVEAEALPELLFGLGGDGRAPSPRLSALALERRPPASTVVLAVTDRFATAAYEPAGPAPSSVFRNGLDDAAGAMSADNPPLYVAEVTYGRQLFLAARAPRPAGDLRAALEGALAGAPGSKELRPGVTLQAVLADADLRVVVRGPEAGIPVDTVRAGPGAYDAVAHLAADRTPAIPVGVAVPVAYTMKYLADRAPVALAVSATFEQARCRPLPDRPFGLVVSGANVDKDLYVWMDKGSGPELVFYSNQPAGGSVDLHDWLARQGTDEAVVQLKVGNADCFHAGANLAITVDGMPRWSLDVDKPLTDCGWQLEAKVRVNQATGEVQELFRWVK